VLLKINWLEKIKSGKIGIGRSNSMKIRNRNRPRKFRPIFIAKANLDSNLGTITDCPKSISKIHLRIDTFACM